MLSPASRLIDTGANAGCMAFLRAHESTASYPVLLQTLLGSAVAATARVALTPLDVAKTVLQVHGRQGWSLLQRKVQDTGMRGLFSGACAASAASIVSHLPWFAVVRPFNAMLPWSPRSHA